MKNKFNVAAIISGSGVISAVVEGKSYTISPDSKYYNHAKNALKQKDRKKLIEAFDLDKCLRSSSNNRLSLKDGKVIYKGGELHNALTVRICELMRKDLPFEPLFKFLGKILLNPRKESVNDLYRFLEFNTLPLTEDGNFLAYKRVTSDFKDFFTEKIDNSIGESPKMPRQEVDSSNGVCSGSGLYVASRGYLDNYHSGEGIIIIVEVDPQNVCAVPTSYENTKMRVCEYKVLQVVEDVDEHNTQICSSPTYNPPQNLSKSGPARNHLGQFTKANV